MRKVGSILFAIVLALSLVLIPAVVSAEDAYAGLAKGAWDKVKWQDNVDSWHLYLQHWGRTPVQSMARLSGLCGPESLCSSSFGISCPGKNCGATAGCPACRDVEQGALATCSDPAACEASLSSDACPATGQAEVECPSEPVLEGKMATCCCCWGRSLAFASKSWAGGSIGAHPRINDDHLNHFGTGDCYGGGKGGDWGISGCPHTEHCSLTWCLQDNLLSNPGIYKKK